MRFLMIALFVVVATAPLKAQDLKVSYFLVGRIRTVEITEGIPFKIKVFAAKQSLLNQQMRFQIVDLEHYAIHYKLEGSEVTREGNFGEELKDPNLRLFVKKDALLNAENVNNLKMLQYLFAISVD
jgi:hypothetical protein